MRAFIVVRKINNYTLKEHILSVHLVFAVKYRREVFTSNGIMDLLKLNFGTR